MEYSAKAFLASIGADQNAEPIRKTPKVAGKKK
jgi:hypothetical protein